MLGQDGGHSTSAVCYVIVMISDAGRGLNSSMSFSATSAPVGNSDNGAIAGRESSEIVESQRPGQQHESKVQSVGTGKTLSCSSIPWWVGFGREMRSLGDRRVWGGK